MGVKLIVINSSSTPMDSQTAVLIGAKTGEVMLRVIQQVKRGISVIAGWKLD
ncbi:hypothetical protein ACFLT4_00500 [Chloroflexota bacterium]